MIRVFRKLINTLAYPILACLVYSGIFLLCNYLYKDYPFWKIFSYRNFAVTYTCEFLQTSELVQQPINTYSNILFLFFGVRIMEIGYQDRKNLKESPNFLLENYHYSFAYGLLMVILCSMSTLFHSTMLPIFSQLDMMAVYASILYPLFFYGHKLMAALYYEKKIFYSYWGSFILVFCLFTSLVTLNWYFYTSLYAYAIPAFIGILIMLGGYYTFYYVEKVRGIFFYSGGVLFLVALIFYVTDQYYCEPHSYFQLHALWHVLSALSQYFFYLFLRSERLAIRQ